MSLVKIADPSNGFFAGWVFGSFCGDVNGVVQATGMSEMESKWVAFVVGVIACAVADSWTAI